MRISRLILILISSGLITLASTASGLADQPMTFQRTDNIFFGVLAQGEITADTPQAFDVFLRDHAHDFLPPGLLLNSGGGDLEAALALGREIRRAGWSTEVGTPGLDALGDSAGICASACTFAFLGGVTRQMAPGSRFGVHRFWTEGNLGDPEQHAQRLAGELVNYIREMGVSTEMYTLMTEAGKGDSNFVNYLDPDAMARLNITTSEVIEAKVADEGGVSVLHLTDNDTGGSTSYGEISFYCHGALLEARGYFLPPTGNWTPGQLSMEWSFNPGGQVPVPQGAFWYRGIYAGKLKFDVDVPPRLLQNWILPAKIIELNLSGPSSWRQVDINSDRVGNRAHGIPNNFSTLLRTMAESCH